jgi:predicted phosphodiesterase
MPPSMRPSRSSFPSCFASSKNLLLLLLLLPMMTLLLLPHLSLALKGTSGAVELAVKRFTQQASSSPPRLHSSKGQRLKVFIISDLHTDYKANLEWVSSLRKRLGVNGEENVVVVGGDVSSNLATLRSTLARLKDAFDDVVFVPGNHDVWTHDCSVKKLLQVLGVCEELGVYTRPVVFCNELCIFPMQSWYSSSWDKEPDLPDDLQHRNGDFVRRWADFRKCKWQGVCSQEEFVTVSSNSTTLSDWMASLNEGFIRAWEEDEDRAPRILTLSHFLPRQELCPEKWALVEPNLPKVVGSDALERQLRQLRSAASSSAHVHCFGHTHIPYDLDLDGIRYVSWPLGSVAEQSRQCGCVNKAGPLLIYDSIAHANQLGFAATFPTLWGEYYREHARNPSFTEIPRWALRRQRKSRPSSEHAVDMDGGEIRRLPASGALTSMESKVLSKVPAVATEQWRMQDD